MRKQNSEVKPLMTRIENLARKEHRNIVGQLTHILETYETVTGITGKRPYQRKSKELAQEKTLKKRKAVAPIGVQLSLLDDVKQRKIRKDKGKSHTMSAAGRKAISATQKLRHARQKLQQVRAAAQRG